MVSMKISWHAAWTSQRLFTRSWSIYPNKPRSRSRLFGFQMRKFLDISQQMKQKTLLDITEYLYRMLFSICSPFTGQKSMVLCTEYFYFTSVWWFQPAVQWSRYCLFVAHCMIKIRDKTRPMIYFLSAVKHLKTWCHSLSVITSCWFAGVSYKEQISQSTVILSKAVLCCWGKVGYMYLYKKQVLFILFRTFFFGYCMNMWLRNLHSKNSCILQVFR